MTLSKKGDDVGNRLFRYTQLLKSLRNIQVLVMVAFTYYHPLIMPPVAPELRK
jgi:hypothetical protein